MKKLLLICLSGVLLFIISGCGSKEIEPRAIDEKNDKCIQCHMSVVDDQFATQLTLENGKTHTFDDIGCMALWVKENKDQKVAAQFVRDYETKEWILLEDAYYVYDESIKTPMAYNVISFANEQKATDFASEINAQVMTSAELDNHQWDMNNDMMMKIKEEMGAGASEHSHDHGEAEESHHDSE
ncbi:nitrous oxide reductase accessory protein NosL [Bacillus tuaregi]|uniref:nitrous oxide reductase accessory protein NosL n=1 Tax=Bacillus tuaregi TaxID=1816695 RepID=UPI000A675228|nr:nitrous oxide reductase accessory protein NosL [Bacillus tuaregi]